jgi:hypothetical protein
MERRFLLPLIFEKNLLRYVRRATYCFYGKNLLFFSLPSAFPLIGVGTKEILHVRSMKSNSYD